VAVQRATPTKKKQDEAVRENEAASSFVLSSFFPFGRNSRRSQRTLQESDIAILTTALENERKEVSSAREFLSDCQTSIVEGNYPRGVLEMAIACEVAIKQAFFFDKTPAGAAFEYLESKQHVEFPVVEFLHGPAQAAFSESFKTKNPKDYQNLEFLFRCRNKIAHRAAAYYSDGKTNKEIDRETLEQWWITVDKLFAWLDKHTGRAV